MRPLEPLSRHTAWRTGGRCGAWVVARSDADVATVVHDCRQVDWKLHVLGAGTRSVVRDGDLPGVVLRLGGSLASLDPEAPGAGAPMPALLERAAALGLTGLERFAGVPGSLGASLLHDDGWEDLVAELEVLLRGSRRPMSLPDARRKRPILLGARLSLERREPSAARRALDAAWRKARPCSWYGGQGRADIRELLRSVRLPLVRLRQVAVPELAPELMVNLGSGTAADLWLLHRSAIERVEKVRGIELQSRVAWWGREPDRDGR